MTEYSVTSLPQPETHVVSGDNILNIAAYSDKSFIVFGEATKVHKDNLKALGGKFNGRLKERPGFSGGAAWIFPMNNLATVKQFVNDVNNGTIPTHSSPPAEGGVMGLPTITGPVKVSKYQTVTWSVFKPAVGMTVTIKAGGQEAVGTVIQVDGNRDKRNHSIIDTAFIDINGATSKLVICSGAWSVWGYMVDHRVYFSDNAPPSPSAIINESSDPVMDI